jgi:hypothetical protein
LTDKSGQPVQSSFPAAFFVAALRLVILWNEVATEAAPIWYVTEVPGGEEDKERPIRWLIALIALWCDPLAMSLTARLLRGHQPLA